MSLDWKQYVVSVAPTGVFSGVDIGFSNWGLELIKVSLQVFNVGGIHFFNKKICRYTMTKSTTVVFILGFAILFKLEKKVCDYCVSF